MRHKKGTTVLDRPAAQRKALVRSLAISLINNGTVQTTPAKAKALVQFVEPVITAGKEKTVNSIRLIEKKLANKEAALKVVNEVGPRFAKRNGGYTSTTKTAPRKGDGAQQVVVTFVD